MSKKTLMDAFEVKTTGIKIDNIEDYDVFKNKDLLDKLRGKIIQNLIDENIPDDKLLDQYINDEIDASTLGYDLNYLQRNYIYNLIKNEINGLSNIESITFNSKKDIANEMKEESEIFNTIISSWSDSENPLYDTYLVKVKNSEKISNTASKIEKIEGVEMVRYGEGMIESLLSIFKIVEKILIVIVVSLVLVTAFLIINTIKITIFSRQEEIEIKRLVGASNFSIKQPFVIEGLFIGVLGSIIPVLVTIYGYSVLYEKTGGILFSKFIQLVEPFPFTFEVSLVLVLIGIVVGMIGSSKAVRKYLKI